MRFDVQQISQFSNPITKQKLLWYIIRSKLVPIFSEVASKGEGGQWDVLFISLNFKGCFFGAPKNVPKKFHILVGQQEPQRLHTGAYLFPFVVTLATMDRSLLYHGQYIRLSLDASFEL